MRRPAILALMLGLSLWGCSDPADPPADGTLAVSTSTSGDDPDPDGFHLRIDDGDSLALPPSGTTDVALSAGRHTLHLGDVAEHCSVAPATSVEVDITAGSTTSLDFTISCPATGAQVTVTTTGEELDQDGYKVAVDDAELAVISANGSISIALDPGSRTIALAGLALNCAVDGPTSRDVTIVTGQVAVVEFSVVCSAIRARIAFVRMPQPLPNGQHPPGTLEIYIANADGSGAMRLTSGDRPAWSPDARRIAFVRDRMVYVIDVNGSNERALHRGRDPAWSPDGTRIVFLSSTCGESGGICTMNADGSGVTLLVPSDFAHPGAGDDHVDQPEWSPDGRISFVRAEPDNNRPPDFPVGLYIVNADGSDPHPLNVSPPFSTNVDHAWSPDGSRIALSWDLRIASVDSNGGDLQIHYDIQIGIPLYPDWSPDGRSLVFEQFTTTVGCARPACPRRIYIVSTEGGPARQLIPEVEGAPAYWDTRPAWARVKE